MPAKRSRSRSAQRGAFRRLRGAGGSYRRNLNLDRNLNSGVVIRKPGSMGEVYKFSRWADLGAIYSTVDSQAASAVITAANPDVIAQLFCQLSSLPNYSDFQALFSQYRITEMEFHFLNCMYTEVNGPQPGVNGSNLIRNFPVYIGTQTDVLGFNTINQMQQEDGVTVRDYVNNGKPLIIKVSKPSINTPAQDGAGAAVIAAQRTGEWLDTSFPAVAYRGVYLGLQDAWNSLGQPATANRAYTIRVRMSLEFRGVR